MLLEQSRFKEREEERDWYRGMQERGQGLDELGVGSDLLEKLYTRMAGQGDRDPADFAAAGVGQLGAFYTDPATSQPWAEGTPGFANVEAFKRQLETPFIESYISPLDQVLQNALRGPNAIGRGMGAEQWEAWLIAQGVDPDAIYQEEVQPVQEVIGGPAIENLMAGIAGEGIAAPARESVTGVPAEEETTIIEHLMELGENRDAQTEAIEWRTRALQTAPTPEVFQGPGGEAIFTWTMLNPVIVGQHDLIRIKLPPGVTPIVPGNLMSDMLGFMMGTQLVTPGPARYEAAQGFIQDQQLTPAQEVGFFRGIWNWMFSGFGDETPPVPPPTATEVEAAPPGVDPATAGVDAATAAQIDAVASSIATDEPTFDPNTIVQVIPSTAPSNDWERISIDMHGNQRIYYKDGRTEDSPDSSYAGAVGPPAPPPTPPPTEIPASALVRPMGIEKPGTLGGHPLTEAGATVVRALKIAPEALWKNLKTVAVDAPIAVFYEALEHLGLIGKVEGEAPFFPPGLGPYQESPNKLLERVSKWPPAGGRGLPLEEIGRGMADLQMAWAPAWQTGRPIPQAPGADPTQRPPAFAPGQGPPAGSAVPAWQFAPTGPTGGPGVVPGTTPPVGALGGRFTPTGQRIGEPGQYIGGFGGGPVGGSGGPVVPPMRPGGPTTAPPSAAPLGAAGAPVGGAISGFPGVFPGAGGLSPVPGPPAAAAVPPGTGPGAIPQVNIQSILRALEGLSPVPGPPRAAPGAGVVPPAAPAPVVPSTPTGAFRGAPHRYPPGAVAAAPAPAAPIPPAPTPAVPAARPAPAVTRRRRAPTAGAGPAPGSPGYSAYNMAAASRHQSQIQQLIAAMARQGYQVMVAPRGGLRTADAQAELYAKGRSGKPGKTVTELEGTPGRESMHQRGTGTDIVFVGPDGQPSWDPSHPWDILGQEGENLGLTWGGRWKAVDLPHFETLPPRRAASAPE